MTWHLTRDDAKACILSQFPEYADLALRPVEKQGHDNRTYRLGSDLLIRIPTAACYALKIPIEQEILQKIAPHLTLSIPTPIKMGVPSKEYPYPFSIYRWLEGRSLNLLTLSTEYQTQLAFDLAQFLKNLHRILPSEGPKPGQHNWWRGAPIHVYDAQVRQQITQLAEYIDSNKAINLWESACRTQWNFSPVWIHGDIAIGNILIQNNRLSAIIDFGGAAIGDPACDLMIAWTYFSKKARDIFISEMRMDANTWLRARAWVVWKITFELCKLDNRGSHEWALYQKIIDEIIEF